LTNRMVDAFSDHTKKQLMPTIESKEAELKTAIAEIFERFGGELDRGVQREIDDLRGGFQKAVARKRELEGQVEQERARLERVRQEAEGRLDEMRSEVESFFKL